VNSAEGTRPTLEELRRQHELEQEGHSRFHKSICPVCGALVTNQAMGRKAHLLMHKRLAAKS
jgi:hypothetical protein